MRILVTGGAGFIGSHTCKALAAAGHVPIAYDDLRTGHRWAVRWGPLVIGDVANRALMERVLRAEAIDLVMHFAASSNVGESTARPDLYYRNNVVATLAMLEAMHNVGVDKLVLSSSCAVYGLPETMPVVETLPQNPINPYGRSKHIVEEVVNDFVATFGLGAIMLRYFNAAGADADGDLGEEHDPETHLIPLVLEAACGERSHISIFGADYPTPDGTCIRDYVHVSDIADAHVRAVHRVAAGEVKAYNLGTERGYSVREVLDTAAAVTGRSIPSRVAPRRTGDPSMLLADASLAWADLGWKARVDLETAIQTAWAWKMHHRNTRVHHPRAAMASA